MDILLIFNLIFWVVFSGWAGVEFANGKNVSAALLFAVALLNGFAVSSAWLG